MNLAGGPVPKKSAARYRRPTMAAGDTRNHMSLKELEMAARSRVEPCVPRASWEQWKLY